MSQGLIFTLSFYIHCHYWDLSFFPAYFISVYINFIIAKNCGFVMGFEIWAIYFRLKNSFLLLFLIEIPKNEMAFKKKSSVVRYYFFFHYWPIHAIFSEFWYGFSYLALAWYSTLTCCHLSKEQNLAISDVSAPIKIFVMMGYSIPFDATYYYKFASWNITMAIQDNQKLVMQGTHINQGFRGGAVKETLHKIELLL